MRLLIYIFLFSFSISVNGQNRNSFWCFGDSAGINFSDIDNPIPISSSMRSMGSCASIADKNGNLLFYCGKVTSQACDNGIVWNRNNEIMSNGDDLNVSAWYHEFLIIPNPGDSNLYYLIHEEVSCLVGLYYSIVDMEADNGLGEVTQKNHFLGCCVFDALSAVKHGNGRDWWLITLKYSNGAPSNEFQLYLISPNGISNPITQNIGAFSISSAADITFSKDGSKMMVSSVPGLIEVFDFDRCTGVLSNFQLIEPELHSTDYIASNTISPNNRFAYVSSNWDTSYVIQYDLTANPINSSADTVGTFYWPLTTTGALRIGPDDKIYLSNLANNNLVYPYPYQDTMYSIYNMYLGVVNYPDSSGLACDFQPYSFFLGGKRTYYGLPNNPNYELGPLTGTLCDSLIGINEEEINNRYFDISPNPSRETITISLLKNNILKENINIEIFCSDGRLYQQIQKEPTEIINIDVSSFPEAVYFISIHLGAQIQTSKFIKMN
jgi:hypothetical protein